MTDKSKNKTFGGGTLPDKVNFLAWALYYVEQNQDRAAAYLFITSAGLRNRANNFRSDHGFLEDYKLLSASIQQNFVKDLFVQCFFIKYMQEEQIDKEKKNIDDNNKGITFYKNNNLNDQILVRMKELNTRLEPYRKLGLFISGVYKLCDSIINFDREKQKALGKGNTLVFKEQIHSFNLFDKDCKILFDSHLLYFNQVMETGTNS
jgi:hypothetical protein